MRYKLFIFDVDGIFTDGGMYYMGNGQVARKFNAHDGLGIRLLQQTKIIPVIVSGKKNISVEERMKVMKIDHVYLGVRHKLLAVEKIMKEFDASFDEIIYMGDDWNDMPVLEKAGCSITVPSASQEIKAVCDYVTVNSGGDGAVREAIELILKQDNLFNDAVKSFISFLQKHE